MLGGILKCVILYHFNYTEIPIMTRRLFTLLFIGTLLFAACQPAATPAPTATLPPPTQTSIPPSPTPLPPTPTEVPAVPVLELVDVDGASTAFTLAEIKTLPVTTGAAGIKSSTGKITLPETWTGVALKDLVELLPAFDDTMGLSVEADDGYSITYSFDQVMNGTFIQYDPGTGEELKTPAPLTAILAYELNGEPLDPDRSGNLRLAIVSDEPKQVTDGHWSVKFVTKVVVRSLGEEWFLQLDGAISETMDRATFESGASPNCHMVTWTDDKAQEWVGLPLWLLVGRVDDEVKHEGPAFHDALAALGYTVDVVSSDGYTVSFESARMARNDNILVAHLVNGNPLPDQYFPLRLVGSDLEKSEMAGMITQIVVHVEGMTPPPLEGDLAISGLVANPVAFIEADLRKMEVVQLTAEHPKKGAQDYAGVRLNSLLSMAGVDPAATTLRLVAGDAYSTTVPLADVTACADCLVAFTDEPNVLNLVMPGMSSGAWIKDIVRIEVLGEAGGAAPAAAAPASGTSFEVPADADLGIGGLVANTLIYQEADLRLLEVAAISAEHPKKGTQSYEGVRLSTLLALAEVDAAAKKLVFTASDGFTAEVFLAEVTACADCMVAFSDESGVLYLVMPGLPSNTWIKDIVKIEIQ